MILKVFKFIRIIWNWIVIGLNIPTPTVDPVVEWLRCEVCLCVSVFSRKLCKRNSMWQTVLCHGPFTNSEVKSFTHLSQYPAFSLNSWPPAASSLTMLQNCHVTIPVTPAFHRNVRVHTQWPTKVIVLLWCVWQVYSKPHYFLCGLKQSGQTTKSSLS